MSPLALSNAFYFSSVSAASSWWIKKPFGGAVLTFPLIQNEVSPAPDELNFLCQKLPFQSKIMNNARRIPVRISLWGRGSNCVQNSISATFSFLPVPQLPLMIWWRLRNKMICMYHTEFILLLLTSPYWSDYIRNLKHKSTWATCRLLIQAAPMFPHYGQTFSWLKRKKNRYFYW